MVLATVAEILEAAGYRVTRHHTPVERLAVGGSLSSGDVTVGTYCGERWLFLRDHEVGPLRDLKLAVDALVERLGTP